VVFRTGAQKSAEGRWEHRIHLFCATPNWWRQNDSQIAGDQKGYKWGLLHWGKYFCTWEFI